MPVPSDFKNLPDCPVGVATSAKVPMLSAYATLVANAVVIVPAKFASSANEAANSFNVSNAAGAEFITSDQTTFVPSVVNIQPSLPVCAGNASGSKFDQLGSVPSDFKYCPAEPVANLTCCVALRVSKSPCAVNTACGSPCDTTFHMAGLVPGTVPVSVFTTSIYELSL